MTGELRTRQERSRLTYGDHVRVLPNAPEPSRPGSNGWVVAIDDIDSEEKAVKRGFPKGARVLLVEFEDGSDVEILEEYLAKQ